jgi:hypothetical protein
MVKWFLRIGVALLIASGLASTALAAADDGQTPATAIQLPTSLSASGNLVGSSEGGFNFYTFTNPGEGTTANISLSVTPNDPNTTNAVGVNLYQNGVNLLSMNGLSDTPGSRSGAFSTAMAGRILVQVYNYLPGLNAGYHFTITGIGAPPEQLGTTAASPLVMPQDMTASGTIVGGRSGAFRFYTLSYPGGVTGTIALHVNPIDSNTTNAVGVNLYHEGANLLTMNGLGSIPGSNSGSFSSPTAGPILIEVYNYLPGQEVTYSFEVMGISP